MTSFENTRKHCLESLDHLLATFFDSFQKSTGSACPEMARYHFATGGKRLRAMIPCFIYEVCGKNPLEALPLGAAAEMIHNATLVHDDLQDGDEARRGSPTVWKKYSEAQAINCGDAMFQYAFELLLQLKIKPERLLRIFKLATASTLNVIEGQSQEFFMKEEKYPTLSRYLGVIRGKTSGLFAFPIVSALEALEFEPDFCAQVEKQAIELGMLFQIQDDVLDVYGEKGRATKATDIAEGKISFLVAHVNEVGNQVDKETLSQILRKPRQQTSKEDISTVLFLFERYQSKSAALQYMQNIKKSFLSNPAFQSFPQIQKVFLELSDVFLEPLHGIL